MDTKVKRFLQSITFNKRKYLNPVVHRCLRECTLLRVLGSDRNDQFVKVNILYSEKRELFDRTI